MSRCPTFTFQVWIMSKGIAKHISIKFSFKITIKKNMFKLHSLTLKMKPVFLFGIWNDERTKLIFLPSFHLVTRLNSQNWNETSLLMKSETLICIWILAFPIGIFQVSSPRKWRFFILFQFLTRLLTSNHFNLISTYLVGRNGVLWKTCFSASQNAKYESQRKLKYQVRNRIFIDS